MGLISEGLIMRETWLGSAQVAQAGKILSEKKYFEVIKFQ